MQAYSVPERLTPCKMSGRLAPSWSWLPTTCSPVGAAVDLEARACEGDTEAKRVKRRAVMRARATPGVGREDGHGAALGIRNILPFREAQVRGGRVESTLVVVGRLFSPTYYRRRSSAASPQLVLISTMEPGRLTPVARNLQNVGLWYFSANVGAVLS